MNIKHQALAWTIAVAGCALPAMAQDSRGVEVHWLDGSAPAVTQGVSWGVPWAQGKIQKDTKFGFKDAHGNDVAVQTWPLAYWPDGSIKWTGFAATAGGDLGNTLEVLPGGKPVAPQSAITVKQTTDAIEITNGPSLWRIGRKGTNLVEAISLNNQVVARNGKLVGEVEERSGSDAKQTPSVEGFESDIASAVVEQSGPVRVVVKIEGKHRFTQGDRAWLPFIVRLYFYSGSQSVRMVHTFIFDGDQEKDFIRGLGIRFEVPMREEFQNRHVRLAGDQGLFAEPIQVIVGRRNPNPEMYEQQVAGKRIPNLDQLPMADNVRQMAVWNDYKLTQLSPDGFAIQKRTNPASAWINATGGKQSAGLAFVGDVSGGLAIDLKNFWRLYPTELEINNAGKNAAEVTVWLWSPDAPAMDMRHYDTVAHGLEASYEDVQPGFSSAYGVARTSELTLHPYPNVPSDEDLWQQAQADQQGALLVCSPQYYHAIPIFGLWSLPDRSTAGRQWLEDQLDKAIAFYQGQVQQRQWYGFWDFGDVMHTYDTARHEWRYDIGGFAWDNTELASNLWLWYSFLRTGRADIYRMAEAMTRQSQEVDVYHIGPWKGLGSRHNVRHWGDGAKELRISQSLFKRFYYYLTTDERTGDLMTEENDAGKALLVVDPLRELPGISQEHKYPTHVRIGPDWLALVSDWYTAWERTGDVKYRDRILAGMNSITAMPNKIVSGENFGYDPKTRTLHQLTNDQRTPSLLPLFGGPELNTEIIPVMNDPAWAAAWLAYCEKGARREPDNARLTAYAAYITKNPNEGDRAWRQLLSFPMRFDSHRVTGAAVPEAIDEIKNISTNATSQWCLNVIELLQLAPEQMPANPAQR
ncbi:MAG TPA: hypothetical protein VHX86_07345 [Tepidisphaeraceae bacterium]|nr:hypothetical protein [Tepidisphaeraceae bacterium]